MASLAAGSTVAVAVALAWTATDPLGLSDPFGVAWGTAATDKLAIMLRFASLLLAVAAVQRRPRESVTAALLIVGSLAVRGLLGPAVLTAAVAWMLAFRPDRTREAIDASEHGATIATFAAPLALAAIFVLDRAGQARALPAPPQHSRELVAYELARGNPYRARFAALEWTRMEPVPGDGHLALAEIDWNLGLRTKALKVLEKVILRGEDETLRRRAEALRTSWSSTGQP